LEQLAERHIQRKPFVKVYHGYGHTGDLVLYGHVFKKEPFIFHKSGGGFLRNFIRLIRLFLVKPIADAKLILRFYDQVIEGKAEYDGFFRFEWASNHQLPAGLHYATVDYVSDSGTVLASGTGSLFIPHVTQYAFISDIDDTIMKSFSATVFRRMYELLAHNPDQRRIFQETVNHYKLLRLTYTEAKMPNPFFYVSSSEWNLYDYLKRIFRYNNLPEGVFLLNQVKRWYQLFKTGHTGHSGKLMRISRILQVFPLQRFVLLGDNSQKDPEIYKAIAEKYPKQIAGVYIRNVRSSKAEETTAILQSLQAININACLFVHSSEAIDHGRSIGLLEP
jgi:phosphatidate phosphatase APP1